MLLLLTGTSMSIFSASFSMDVTSNPLIDSPFVMQNQVGHAYPPIGTDFMITEDGIDMVTEDENLMITE